MLASVALTLAALTASTSPRPSSVQAPIAPQAIVGGEETEAGEFDGVVAIVSGGGLCTGTLVEARTVLTAAHCLYQLPAGFPIQVYYGRTLEGQRSVDVESFGAFPDFCVDCKNDAMDYGYVRTTQAFTPEAIILPLTDQLEWDETIYKGAPLTLVGYGEDPNSSDPNDGTGTKRRVDVTIREQSSSGFEFFAGMDFQDTCEGDSGGPALVQLASGEWRLAGITSRGSNPCGNGGFYGTPYPALEWLREQTEVDLCGDCGGCDCLDTAPPPSKEGCCSVGGDAPPPVWTATALAGLWLVGFRRRRAART